MNNVFVLLSVSHLYSLSFQNPQYPILFNNENDYLGESDGGFDIQNSPPNQNRMSPSFQNSINQNIPDSMSFSDQNRLVNPSYQNYQNRMNPSMNPAFQDSWSLADQNGRANPAIDYAQNEMSPPINPPPINPMNYAQNEMSPPINPPPIDSMDYAQNEMSPPINPPPINPIFQNGQNEMSPPINPIFQSGQNRMTPTMNPLSPNRLLPKKEINSEGINRNSGTLQGCIKCPSVCIWGGGQK